MRYLVVTMVCLLFFAQKSGAQEIGAVLWRIEQNNLELKAQWGMTEAGKFEIRSQNNLEDPSIEYSPFFEKGVDGIASSELVVSQGFDFPTQYAARNRQGKLAQIVLDRQLGIVRRDILLEAKNLCLDLVRLNREQGLLAQRMKNADELLALFEKRLEEGDANILEVNKIKMERMNVRSETVRNRADFRRAMQSLIALNGNEPLEFAADAYPEVWLPDDYQEFFDRVVFSNVELDAANASVNAAERNVSVQKQNWLPKIEVGYRRNTALDEASNGFLVGGSVPLFSNRKKQRIAEAQSLGARFMRDDVQAKVEAEAKAQFYEMQQLQELLEIYDIGLLHTTLDMLNQAVAAGQLSIIEYYAEAENVYQNLTVYIGLEAQYQKLLASILKNEL